MLMMQPAACAAATRQHGAAGAACHAVLQRRGQLRVPLRLYDEAARRVCVCIARAVVRARAGAACDTVLQRYGQLCVPM
jgi:hypothetical protein